MKLNCDLGEGFGRWSICDEQQVMPYIDMANVACGYHAGDPLTMRATVRLALQHGVQVGAHPSYPDLAGFGRRSMECSSGEITAFTLYQIGALREICRAEGGKLSYVKPHGALYNDMMKDIVVMRALMTAIAQAGGDLPLMILATADRVQHESLAAEYGVKLLFEAFADRRYTADCRLMPRSEPGAVLSSEADILKQVRHLANGSVTSDTGEEIALLADCLCVHGDNEEGIAMIKTIRAVLAGGD
ncbi:5-oxoprolinase subunit PxpA [Biformimicrobium ophioploci]|uniref:5-oxoprolinase subunit PxpA n=1 Tax=Biformimicrobium ophioploci TaxID=3036711 RepID=A0ABQ6LXD5_9GAMM|nr:5-oxoprolinase subunit PxpA [Microbulbifer sp. NKW57]GMG86762.1 5-oxoprolinase subunit PxpA [Microbulbifer sp. NKW57]